MNARRKEGRREDDPLQYQMDLGDSETDIIQFIFKILFAGSVNTAAMSAWMIVYVSRPSLNSYDPLSELLSFTACLAR